MWRQVSLRLSSALSQGAADTGRRCPGSWAEGLLSGHVAAVALKTGRLPTVLAASIHLFDLASHACVCDSWADGWLVSSMGVWTDRGAVSDEVLNVLFRTVCATVPNLIYLVPCRCQEEGR